MDGISVRIAGKVGGFGKNTMASLAHRGQVPPPPYSPGDVASLLLARRLCDHGLRTAAALEIAFAVKPEWPEIIVAADAAEYARRWLAVWPAPAGDTAPFIWGILPADAKLGGLIEAHGERGLILIDASDVVREVLPALRSQAQAKLAGKVIGNAPFALEGTPAPSIPQPVVEPSKGMIVDKISVRQSELVDRPDFTGVTIRPDHPLGIYARGRGMSAGPLSPDQWRALAMQCLATADGIEQRAVEAADDALVQLARIVT